MGAQEPLEEDVEMGESKPMMDEGDNDKAPAKRKHKTRGGQIIDIACIGLNIISTVTLVFLNKWFVQIDQPPFPPEIIEAHQQLTRQQDSQRSPVEEDADILRHVAFHLHDNSPLDSESITL